MLINYDGKEYPFELDDITVSQATAIKRRLNLTLLGIEKGLAEVDVDALRAIYWLMLAQNGETRDIDRVDFKPLKYAVAIRNAIEAEEAKKAEEGEAPKEQ